MSFRDEKTEKSVCSRGRPREVSTFLPHKTRHVVNDTQGNTVNTKCSRIDSVVSKVDIRRTVDRDDNLPINRPIGTPVKNGKSVFLVENVFCTLNFSRGVCIVTQ